jgi:hypothetical protein
MFQKVLYIYCQGITFWLHSKPYMHYFLQVMVVAKQWSIVVFLRGPNNDGLMGQV